MSKKKSKISKTNSSLQAKLQEHKTILQKYFRDSATILVARATAIGGFATAVIGGLDWAPLLGMSGMDRKQVIAMGTIILLIGISHEVARRRNGSTDPV